MLRRLRWGCVLVACVVCASCSPMDSFWMGGYDLSVDDVGTIRTGMPLWIRVAEDGAFAGSPNSTLMTCRDALSDLEYSELTAALNEFYPDVPHRAARAAGRPLWRLTGSFETGPRPDTEFEFVGAPLATDTQRLASAIIGPLARRADDGTCTECPQDGCVFEGYESERLCRDGRDLRCNEGSAPSFELCPAFAIPLECAPTRGWIPAIRLDIEAASSTRLHFDDGRVHAIVSITIRRENPTQTAVVGFRESDWWQVEAADTGAPIGLPEQFSGGTFRPTASPALHEITFRWDLSPEAALMTARAMVIRIRARPWTGAIWGTPLEVVVEDRDHVPPEPPAPPPIPPRLPEYYPEPPFPPFP